MIEYEISDEPRPSRDDDLLTDEDCKRLHAIAEDVVNHNRPQRHIRELEALLQKYPHHRQAHNYLTAAYQQAGQVAAADEMIRLTYQRFPKYLFAVTNYCHQLIQNRRADEIPAVLNNDFAIHHFCNGRKQFHTTEFVAWQVMLAHYYVAVGEPDRALVHLQMAEDIWPDHPEVLRLHDLLNKARWAALQTVMAEFLPKRKSQPRLPSLLRR